MDDMNDVDDFVDYATGLKSEFPSLIRGATEQEIQELVRLVGSPLPDVYEAFLLRMGHGDGGLSLGLDGTTEISQIITYYRDCLAEESEPFPVDCVVIGTGRISGDICLEYVAGRMPRGVFTEGKKVFGLYADSFIGLLYRSAFEMFRMYGMGFTGHYVASCARLGMKSVLGVARQVAVEIGFREQWFSDSVVFCGEMPGAAVVITQYQGQGMGVLVAAEEKSELERIASVFVEGFGLKSSRGEVPLMR